MSLKYKLEVEKWDVQEVTCFGKTSGNPFIDYDIQGVFRGRNEKVVVQGFYDGDGIYKVRFMPSFEGNYTFEISGSFGEGGRGDFYVTCPGGKNHGPVRVANTYHFAYEDGTPYYSVGTTCYVWNLQSDERITDTLNSLEQAGFNKIRFCILPKHYEYNLGEPRSYPYEGTPIDSSILTADNFMEYSGKKEGNTWDFTRFNTKHFQHIEGCIEALKDRNIEADIIVMHAYDRWGFSKMEKEDDTLYWNYVIARFAAYRNIWWSLANEYDLLENKDLTDWERYAQIICERDPYKHLRSIHNGGVFYDYSRPWITHCSIQRIDIYKTSENVNEWRERYKKPVVLDEIGYEGDIQWGWGNITAEEMVRRFWEGVCRGAYIGHGETYTNSKDILWWSHGGNLHGESWKRVQFLHKIMCETPGIGLRPSEICWDIACAVPEDSAQKNKKVQDYYLFYFSFMRPSYRDFYFDDGSQFKVEVIDTWNMNIQKCGVFSGRFRIKLPGRQYIAVRIKRLPKKIQGECENGE